MRLWDTNLIKRTEKFDLCTVTDQYWSRSNHDKKREISEMREMDKKNLAFTQFGLNSDFAREIMNFVMPDNIMYSISLLSQHYPCDSG